ncbi:MAG: DUF1579 domain-containing protein [Limisphaerales bacterium]
MKPSTLAGLATILTAVTIGQLYAQDTSKKDEKASGKSEAEMTAAMMELAQPGENHKLLERTVGIWTYKAKWWTSPQAAPMEFGGTCSTKSVMDGRYFISEVNGKMSVPGPDGKPAEMQFKGMGTDGYDNAKKKYVASWIDNFGTGIMMMEGTYDPATKAVTYRGEEEPLPGMKIKVRQIVKTTDDDHRSIEFFEDRSGTEVKTMEITYTRS